MSIEIFGYTDGMGNYSDRCLVGKCDLPLVSQHALITARHERDRYRHIADSISERVKTLETAMRCLLKGDKEAAKSLMEMEP